MTTRKETRKIVEAGLAKRRRKEIAFQAVGMLATAVGVVFLAVFFTSLVSKGTSAFNQTFLKLEVEFSEATLLVDGEIDFAYADFDGLARQALRDIIP